jgi:enamine deaminase RidA (YjgF/YER057c/UK114 family)
MFYAGVVGAHPETGLIVYGANELADPEWERPGGGLAERRMREPVSAQTFTIYKLLRAMLEEHGLSLSDLLKINVYLKSMSDLPEMERVAQQFFRMAKPAAGIIGVESLARRDFLIEIEGIAASTQGGDAIKRASGDAADWALYAKAARGGGLVYASGTLGVLGNTQLPATPADLSSEAQRVVARAIDGLRVEAATQLAAAAQTWVALERIRAALDKLDSRLSDLLKITVYLRDMRDFPFVHAVARAMLGDDPPAISALAVADLPLAAARVEIEAVAV